MNNQNKYLINFWHHTGGTDKNPLASTKHHGPETIDDWHRAKWGKKYPHFHSQVYKRDDGRFYFCGYNAVLDWSKITEENDVNPWVWTRAPGEETGAAIGYNNGRYLHFCIPGNYDVGADEWDARADKWIVWMHNHVATLDPVYVIADNQPHRSVATKSCFGNSLDDKHIQRIIVSGLDEDTPINPQTDLQIKLMKRIVMLLQKQVNMLTEKLTGKRLSLKD